jgi:TatD DNase family protein
LRQDLPGVLLRARQAGVTRIICAAGDLQESRAAAAIAAANDGVWFTAGVHPHGAKDVAGSSAGVASPDADPQAEERAGRGPEKAVRCVASIAQLAAEPQNVAVGEIGLDYHYDLSPRATQRQVFAEQLALAVRLRKPVVLHTREAFDDTLAILAESRIDGARVLLHCCTEPAPNVRRALDLGTTVSFSGIVTFRNSGHLRQAALIVPDDRLLIETDAPFCSPEPMRKMKTNEPANVLHVAACLAGLRGTTSARLAELTTANAVRFFALG